MAEKKKRKKPDLVPITARVSPEMKRELDDLAERLPGQLSLNGLIVQMLEASLPILRETANVFDMVKNAPNPSLVAERMEAFLEDTKRNVNMYGGMMTTAQREVMAQNEAVEARE
jgi:hypothetical protein